MTTRYVEDKRTEREAGIIRVLRVVLLVGVWILVGMAAFAGWLATAR